MASQNDAACSIRWAYGDKTDEISPPCRSHPGCPLYLLESACVELQRRVLIAPAIWPLVSRSPGLGRSAKSHHPQESICLPLEDLVPPRMANEVGSRWSQL
jgi:hypothetical protein